jgi:galacturonosyltransferase
MKEKGISELFAAMQQLVAEGLHVQLDVLGGYEEDYKCEIEKYEREGWLHYHGYQNDVRPYIRDCNCFVLPSWHEGMANTNLESAASGRPIITSNIHGCLEAVEDGVSGFLCEKKNVEDLYRVMKRFTELSYDERRMMGLAGRKRMEKLFDKQKIVEATIRGINGAYMMHL